MFVDRRLTFRGQRRSQLVASVASLPWLLDTVILERSKCASFVAYLLRLAYGHI